MDKTPTYEELGKDIQRQNQVEKDLYIAQARLQQLLTSGPAVFYSCEPHGNYSATFVSESVKAQFGYDPQEFINVPNFWADHIHPDDRPRVFSELSQLFEQGHHIHEYRFKLKDGTYRWMRDELNLLRDAEGNPMEITGYLIDIEESKQSEEALRESEERYRQLFNNESDAVMIFDAKSNQFEDANPATLNLFGYSKEEFLNLTVEDISAEKAKTKVAVGKVKSGDSEGKIVPLRYFKKKDGVIFPGEIYAGAFISDGHKKIIGAVRDITERMRSEEALRKLYFSWMIAQETQRKQIALELHNDLGSALTLLKLQMMNIQNKLSENQDELKAECKNLSKYTTEIIEKVRELSHGLTPSILDHLGLTASLQSLADDFSQYSHMNIRKDIADIDRLLSSEAEITIYRIFQEIFTNIEKHAKADYVKIEVKKQHGNVSFQIEDDGKGFDLKKSELKYQYEKGLGLPSMEEGVLMLGGRFEIQSRLNEGTKINFTIPFKKAAIMS